MDHVEFEYDAPNNGDFAFRPASRKIRGRFDANRLVDGGKVKQRFPNPIPGQRLGWDGERAYIREPLHDAEYKAIRQEIERNAALDADKTYLEVDLPTFNFWVREAMKAGKLKLVQGQLPKVTGEPKKHFRMQPEPSETAQLTAEFRRIGDLLEKVLAKK